MTDAERLELQRSTVARIRRKKARIPLSLAANRFIAANPELSTLRRPDLAARYAHAFGVGLAVAAFEFGIARSAVTPAWRRLCPGVPALPSRRRA